jgi:hypothetical protein
MFGFKTNQPRPNSPRRDLVYRKNHDKKHWSGGRVPDHKLYTKASEHDDSALSKPAFRPCRGRVYKVHAVELVKGAVEFDFLGLPMKLLPTSTKSKQAKQQPKGPSKKRFSQTHHSSHKVFGVSERRIKEALLLVYHYRFQDKETIVRKCSRTSDHITGYSTLKKTTRRSGRSGVSLCTKELLLTNHPEQLDTSLRDKAMRRSREACHSEKTVSARAANSTRVRGEANESAALNISTGRAENTSFRENATRSNNTHAPPQSDTCGNRFPEWSKEYFAHYNLSARLGLSYMHWAYRAPTPLPPAPPAPKPSNCSWLLKTLLSSALFWVCVVVAGFRLCQLCLIEVELAMDTAIPHIFRCCNE